MLDPTARDRLAILADVLIPGSGAFPSASAAGVPTDLIDRVLGFRPDLVPAFTRDSGWQVKTLAVGSGQAIELAGHHEVEQDHVGRRRTLVFFHGVRLGRRLSCLRAGRRRAGFHAASGRAGSGLHRLDGPRGRLHRGG